MRKKITPKAFSEAARKERKAAIKGVARHFSTIEDQDAYFLALEYTEDYGLTMMSRQVRIAIEEWLYAAEVTAFIEDRFESYDTDAFIQAATVARFQPIDAAGKPVGDPILVLDLEDEDVVNSALDAARYTN